MAEIGSFIILVIAYHVVVSLAEVLLKAGQELWNGCNNTGKTRNY